MITSLPQASRLWPYDRACLSTASNHKRGRLREGKRTERDCRFIEFAGYLNYLNVILCYHKRPACGRMIGRLLLVDACLSTCIKPQAGRLRERMNLQISTSSNFKSRSLLAIFILSNIVAMRSVYATTSVPLVAK